MVHEHGIVWVHYPILLPFFQRRTAFKTSCLLQRTEKLFQNEGYSLYREFTPTGANSFLEGLTPLRLEPKDQNENDIQ